MQSTVVLEAAVAGKPVILPHFREMCEREGSEQVLMYQDYRDLFDVPDDAADLKRMVMERLANPQIDEETMCRRRAMFEAHVSPLTGEATDVSLDLIRSLARAQQGG